AGPVSAVAGGGQNPVKFAVLARLAHRCGPFSRQSQGFFMRTHYCGQVTEALLDTEVTVAGWVHRRRDHGGVTFVDLRDREGLLQVVFDPDAANVFARAETLRSEFVIRVAGKVRRRPAGTENPNLPTGQVEVYGTALEILNRAETPPFM